MELIDGRSLRDLLADQGRLSPDQASAVTADICAALEFSHAHGVVHRDIKPGNVMPTQAGQVKVVDFGIAWALTGEPNRLTEPLTALGTAGYLPTQRCPTGWIYQAGDRASLACHDITRLTMDHPLGNPTSFLVRSRLLRIASNASISIHIDAFISCVDGHSEEDIRCVSRRDAL